MSKKLTKYSEWLFELVKGFDRLRPTDFEQKFSDDVADLDDSLKASSWRIIPELGELIVLNNGYAVLVDRTNRFSLFETEEHHTQRTYLAAWARFVRGAWTDVTPLEPGVYFAKDRDLGRRSVREISKVNGRTVDISGGNVPAFQVTTWKGFWWVPAIPRLPGAY